MPEFPLEPHASLVAMCGEALAQPISPALRDALDALRREISSRHGDAGAALILYGSCLRADRSGDSLEGVPDLVFVVDSYAHAYPATPTVRGDTQKGGLPRSARWLRRANRWLPPNVFPLFSTASEPGPLRTKYAVLSLEDLERSCGPRARDAFVWARLCQPCALLWARDEASRHAVAAAAASAVETAVQMALPVLAGRRDTVPVDPKRDSIALWSYAFAETYRAEWRFETRQRSGDLVRAASDYYERMTAAAIAALDARGTLHKGTTLDPIWARRQRRQWKWRRRRGKILAALRLVKSALTFGDWVPYALWKMERHTGVRLEASEAQRRHPFLLGWPLILRALRTRVLR